MAVFCALLLLTLIIGLWRVLLGPRRVDRLLADAALALALLAAMISAALVQLLRRSRHE